MSGGDTDLTRLGDRARLGSVVCGPVGSGVSSVLLAACARERADGGTALHLTADAVAEMLGRDLPAAMEVLQRLHPTLVAVDDASLLDDHTSRLLTTLVTNTDIRFAVGVQPGGARAAAIVALTNATSLAEIVLNPLPPPLVGALCADILRGAVHTATVNEICRRTAGWPGLVTDLVRHAHGTGTLRESSGLFRFVSDPGLPEATVRRVDALRRAFDPAAVDALERLALGNGVHCRLADLPAAVRASQLVHESAGVVRLTTANIADALVATTPTDRLRALAETFLDEQPDREEPLRVSWQLAAGRTPARGEIADAARAARAAGDVWGAVRLVAAAVDAGDHRADTMLLRADLAQETGDWVLGAHLLGQLIADPTLDPVQRGLAVAELSSAKLWDLNQPDEAMAVATAMRDLALGSEWEPTASAVLGSVLVYHGNVRDAVPQLEPVVQHRSHPSLLAAASTAFVLAGRSDEAVEVADRAMAIRRRLHQQVGVPSMEVYANAQMMAYAERGDLDRAMAIADELAADRSATGLRTGWLAIGIARVQVMRGDLAAAQHASDESAVTFADLNRHAMLRWAHAGQALVAAYQGRVADSAAALAMLDRIGPSAVGFLEVDIDRARAFHLAAAGDLTAARTLLRGAAQSAERLGNLTLAASAWHDLARLGVPDEAFDALARLAPSIVSRWNEPRLEHARSLVTRDAAGLLRAADGFAAISARLHATESAAQAHAIARAANDRSLVQRTLAATLTHQCAGADTPALREAPTAQLTPREREVAELVAGGRTSREAAGALGVSVRTVENLLQRVYTKLAIQDRASLADVLGRS